MLQARLVLLSAALSTLSGAAHGQDAFLDKQSAYPGETVTVYASVPPGNPYSVSIKRSTSFASNVEVLRSPGLEPAVQPTSSGSFADVASTPALELRDAISLEAWVRPTGGNDFRGILSKYGTPGDEAYMIYLMPSGQLSFYLGAGPFSAENRLLTSSALPLRQWTHVVATWDGQTKRVYLDGQLDVTQPWRGADPADVGASARRGVWQPGSDGRVLRRSHRLARDLRPPAHTG